MNGHVTIKMASTFTVQNRLQNDLDFRKSPRTGIVQKVCMFPRDCVIVQFIPSFTLLTVTPCKRMFGLWLNLKDFNQDNTDYEDQDNKYLR